MYIYIYFLALIFFFLLLQQTKLNKPKYTARAGQAAGALSSAMLSPSPCTAILPCIVLLAFAPACFPITGRILSTVFQPLLCTCLFLPQQYLWLPPIYLRGDQFPVPTFYRNRVPIIPLRFKCPTS